MTARAAQKSKADTKPPVPAATIEIQIDSPLWDAVPTAEQTVRGAISAAAAVSTTSGEVSILLTDDSAIRKLNREWRGIDKPTNVLSFPASGHPAPGAAGFLGDVVIAHETLRRECDDEDRDFLHHLSHLTVHGYLHLIGFDHQTDREADVMEALESKIMASMNMPDPWLDRGLERDSDGV